jgi:hypothetical protein
MTTGDSKKMLMTPVITSRDNNCAAVSGAVGASNHSNLLRVEQVPSMCTVILFGIVYVGSELLFMARKHR